MGNTLSGQQELVQIAAEQAELDQDFDPLDKENNQTDRLITCIKLTLPLFSVSISKMYIFIVFNLVLITVKSGLSEVRQIYLRSSSTTMGYSRYTKARRFIADSNFKTAR